MSASLRFLAMDREPGPATPPRWLSDVVDALGAPTVPSTALLATRLGLNPAWLARAYRNAAGEGLGDTIRRKRVERAARLLRATETPIAAIAHDVGFCDQSHMARAFGRVLGRPPSAVRSDRPFMRRSA